MAHSTSPHLYENNGDGTYTDILSSVIPTGVCSDSWAGAWGDYDNDGYVDLYVVRAGMSSGSVPTPGTVIAERDYLLRNMMYADSLVSRTFQHCPRDIIDQTRHITAAWCDLDDDGYIELFTPSLAPTSPAHKSILYQNNGAGIFTDAYSSFFPLW